MAGIEIITAERRRQVEIEGWSPGHDATHRRGELAAAATAYILFNLPHQSGIAPHFWPWEKSSWKPDPKDAIRNLARAGALIAAEIDRLQRSLAAGKG